MSGRLGVRGRLVLSYIFLAGVALAAVNLLAVASVRSQQLGERERTLLRHATLVAGVSERYFVKGHQYLEFIARDYGQELGARVLVLDGTGRVIDDSFYERQMLGRNLSSHAQAARALAGTPSSQAAPLPEGGRTLYAAAPILQQGRVVGAVLISQSIADLDAAIRAVRDRLAGVSAIALGIAALGAAWLGTRKARPLQAITAASRAMAAGDLTRRVPAQHARAPAEIGELARALNDMAERLDRLERARQVFIADAAHELRSPLAAISSLLEPLLSGAVSDPAQQLEFIADAERELQRLMTLAEDLLTLSRIEAGPPLRTEALDVAALAERVAERIAPLAAARQARVEVRRIGPGPALAWGERNMLERALYNLVHNAVCHSPAGRSVGVEVEGRGATLEITVSDEGPGIAADDLPLLFERFFRSDRARSRETGGSGLGLAIAHAAVRRHGGSLVASNRPEGGAAVSMRLPRAGGPPTPPAAPAPASPSPAEDPA